MILRFFRQTRERSKLRAGDGQSRRSLTRSCNLRCKAVIYPAAAWLSLSEVWVCDDQLFTERLSAAGPVDPLGGSARIGQEQVRRARGGRAQEGRPRCAFLGRVRSPTRRNAFLLWRTMAAESHHKHYLSVSFSSLTLCAAGDGSQDVSPSPLAAAPIPATPLVGSPSPLSPGANSGAAAATAALATATRLAAAAGLAPPQGSSVEDIAALLSVRTAAAPSLLSVSLTADNEQRKQKAPASR